MHQDELKMSLSSELISKISGNCGFICITGGGGKTSLMQLLAEEYKSKGLKVLMTTTTKVQSPLVYNWKCDQVFTNEIEVSSFTPNSPCSVLFAQPCKNPEKLSAPDYSILKKLTERYDVVICEADGSKQQPIKWHTEKDPVVPDFCTYTIAVMGSWGKTESYQDYVDSPQGLLKGSIKEKRCVLINGCENITLDEAIVFSNIQWPADCVILEASVIKNELYRMH